MAAAYTTLIGYVVMAMIEAVWAKKIYRAKMGMAGSVYDDGKIIALSVITIALTLSGLIWYTNTVLRYTVIGIGLIIAAVFVRKMLKNKKLM